MMKKTALFVGVGLIFGGMEAFAAINCATLPSCATLGYTETAGTCRAKFNVCPFDATKVTCINDGPHIGDLKYSLYSANHDGWLKCDGTQYSTSTYSKLYSVIGTNFCHRYTSKTDTSYYTNNCTSGKFAVPDYRGFFLRGISSYNATSNTVGAYSTYYSYALYYKGGSDNSSLYSPQYEQLPNITGTGLWWEDGARTNRLGGALYLNTTAGKTWSGSGDTDTNNYTVDFNASNSNSIYSGSHVIPANYGAYIYIYAGQ